jgi:hypothetical protein
VNLLRSVGFSENNNTGPVAREVSMEKKVTIVLFRQDCSEFWVYNLTDRTGWAHYTPQRMAGFLSKL